MDAAGVTAESEPLVVEAKLNDAPFTKESTRSEFLLRVFGMQMCQLVITSAIASVIFYSKSMVELAADFPWLLVGFILINAILLIVLAFFDNFRRDLPFDLLSIVAYAIVQGVAIGALCAYCNLEGLIFAAAISACIMMILTVFSLQSVLQLSWRNGILAVVALGLIAFGILCVIFQTRFLAIAFTSLGATVFCVYLVLDALMMVNGMHKYALSSNEFIFAALNLHLDIVNLIRYGIGMLVAKACRARDSGP